MGAMGVVGRGQGRRKARREGAVSDQQCRHARDRYGEDWRGWARKDTSR